VGHSRGTRPQSAAVTSGQQQSSGGQVSQHVRWPSCSGWSMACKRSRRMRRPGA